MVGRDCLPPLVEAGEANSLELLCYAICIFEIHNASPIKVSASQHPCVTATRLAPSVLFICTSYFILQYVC